ncbi:uncharacterized protein LOC126989057 [Eriocheir sinensis]|uniref:uncharacterized protein LOC126989057 n=1 Tax=Eriocheir sinensis TaxID=95602 RepID=UPI0021C686A6|nr:uncharacterized protein LOC126989057 [Eriocheir sinensis]
MKNEEEEEGAGTLRVSALPTGLERGRVPGGRRLLGHPCPRKLLPAPSARPTDTPQRGRSRDETRLSPPVSPGDHQGDTHAPHGLGEEAWRLWVSEATHPQCMLRPKVTSGQGLPQEQGRRQRRDH